MGYVPSASAITATAYLTERGREYLFNKNNIRFDSSGDDLFEIKTFTLSDADINYRTTTLLVTGEVPDISGENENCLKTSVDVTQRNLLFFQNFDSIISDDVEYSTSLVNNILNVNLNTGTDDLIVGTDSPDPSPITPGGGNFGGTTNLVNTTNTPVSRGGNNQVNTTNAPASRGGGNATNSTSR